MNFRGFASKLKASAAEVAQKIPTFDDMAAKDVYIHTDDDYMPASREVVPPRRTPPQHKRGPSEQNQEESQQTGGDDVDEIASTGSAKWSLLDNNRLQTPISATSKKQSLVSPLPTASTTPASPLSTADEPNNDNKRYDRSMSSPLVERGGARTGLRKQNSNSSLPLLSVVADALLHNDDEGAIRSRGPGFGSDGGSRSRINDDTTISMSSSNEIIDDSSTDSSDDASDDQDNDDPILSMIQKSNKDKFQNRKQRRQRRNKSTPSSSWDTSSSSRRKNGLTDNTKQMEGRLHQSSAIMTADNYHDDEEQAHLLRNGGTRSIGSGSSATNGTTPKRSGNKNPKRFLDDLDERLFTSTGATPLELEMGGRSPGLDHEDNASSTATAPASQRWGWVKTMATSHVDRFLGRFPIPGSTGTHTSQLQQQKKMHRPPLARKQEPKPSSLPLASPDDDFHVTVSTSVLGDNELKELAQMKNRSNFMDLASMMVTLLKENRQFAFIGATMVLAALVYFYTRHSTIQYSSE